LIKGKLDLSSYQITTTNAEFQNIVLASGLVNPKFPEEVFKSSYKIHKNYFLLKNPSVNERLAQIVAYFLIRKLLVEKKKFSFETVFSHASKLAIMQDAVNAGYKVYLYFVSTESPEINKSRVLLRKERGDMMYLRH
jgi:hypothetical protein